MSYSDTTIEAAFIYCRAVAKREAKNFYYGFLALPTHKRDAMCAVYAFMRRADDLSDDETLSIPQRRELMARWLHSWRSGDAIEPQDAPVFLAVRYVQERFSISSALLEQLVQGTTMDLQPTLPAGVRRIAVGPRVLDQYETVAALEGYCYLVASVVGLVTIRIFGYADSGADRFAEQLGLAFQLTNILRDVREDAERGRIYLPQELLAKYGLEPPDVLEQVRHEDVSPAMQTLLAELAIRAQSLYAAADRLIPLLDADSRPAMHVLVNIYHLLLRQIIQEHYRVFGERVRVSTVRKVAVLSHGLLRGVLSRVKRTGAAG